MDSTVSLFWVKSSRFFTASAKSWEKCRNPDKTSQGDNPWPTSGKSKFLSKQNEGQQFGKDELHCEWTVGELISKDKSSAADRVRVTHFQRETLFQINQ